MSVFVLTAWVGMQGQSRHIPPEVTDRIVISAPVQLLVHGGDRFLAANLEVIRLAATASGSNDRDSANYLTRAHSLAAQLNPCHEDNYYLGNAILSWGGMQEESLNLLERATECRFWDEVPPFFLGFNHYFFYRNIDAARHALEVAAGRASENAAALRKLAVMLAVGQIDDEKMALSYLREQIQSTDDIRLKEMLEKRLKRLEGLIALRQGQQHYEEKTGHSLQTPQQLIDSGIIEQFPHDPLGLGYEFVDGIFRLRTLKIEGLENHQ
ncbi:hypothetical protein [Thiohalomonas denitrificans]|uniref:hypothetical protein n=1 Tax=Thiohalomonas denitrificans TaxID=415747 RepID=UPI0026ED4469|nr:hypothetical protein [Thiohalomonas denitrificans]